MSKHIPNQYAISPITYQKLEKMGYKIDDMRPDGINQVVIKEKQKQGKRYYSIGKVYYENGDIFPSNEYLAGLISQANWRIG